jgi:hypothetical protein
MVLMRPGYTPLAAQPSPEHMAATEAVCGWHGGSSMSLIGACGVGSFGLAESRWRKDLRRVG